MDRREQFVQYATLPREVYKLLYKHLGAISSERINAEKTEAKAEFEKQPPSIDYDQVQQGGAIVLALLLVFVATQLHWNV